MSEAITHKVPVKHALNNISDVLIAAPANDEVLTYELATEKWKNKAAAAGSAWKLMKASLVVTNQTIATETWTTAQLSVELVDDDNAFNPATYKYTAPATGRYLIVCGMMWSNMTDQTDVEMRLVDDAVTVAYLYNVMRMSGSGWLGVQSVNVIELPIGKVIKLQVYQASGSNRVLNGSNQAFTFLTIYRVLP